MKKAQYYENIRKKVGIIGNKILHYYFPKTIQYAGGAKYYKWIGIASAIGGFKKDDGRYDVNEIAMDQVSGASMFVRKEFLNSVGLLCEDYFLFSEEIDWAERGRSKGWGLGYEWRAKVYHKVSASTGNHALPKKIKKSKFTDFYVIRSTLIFTRKFFPICLPTVYLGILGMLINRLRRGQINRVGMILKILINPSKDL